MHQARVAPAWGLSWRGGTEEMLRAEAQIGALLLISLCASSLLPLGVSQPSSVKWEE